MRNRLQKEREREITEGVGERVGGEEEGEEEEEKGRHDLLCCLVVAGTWGKEEGYDGKGVRSIVESESVLERQWGAISGGLGSVKSKTN